MPSRFEGPHTRRGWLDEALRPAFVIEPRDLTADGLTQPGHRNAAADLGPGSVVVVIPAHNEAELIAEALRSVAAQTRIPDEVIVITDRCTDLTGEIALAHQAVVIASVDNHQAKAGALNQVLCPLLERLTDDDAVLIMDADGSLSPRFLAQATRRLREPEGGGARVGGIGAIFFGYPVRGLVGHLQDNEYVRYAREIRRRKGRADVLTGTATLFSVRALREVERARADGRLPAGGGVCSVDALTEDNELTLALKKLCYRCVSPRECTVGTEVMPTTARLLHQRLRWQRGAIENLREYGWTGLTLPYIGRQILTYVGVAFLPFFLTALIYTVATTESLPWSWFWIWVTIFVLVERVWSVRRGGWRSVGLALLVVPEIAYDVLLHGVYVKAMTDSLVHERETWDHTKAGESDRKRPWAHRWHRFSSPVYMFELLILDVGVALVCSVLGVAWPLIGFLVLVGAAMALLRVSGLDPMGPILGSGEVADVADVGLSGDRQGFGRRRLPSSD